MLQKLTLIILILIYFSFLSLGQQKDVICLNKFDGNSISSIGNLMMNNKILLIGENHEVALNYILYYHLIKNLSEEHDVKNILIEKGISDAYLINKYMESGNEEYLQNMFFTNEGLTLFKKLFVYNRKLPHNKKIKFIGVDAESGSCLKMLKIILGTMDSISPEFKEFKSLLDNKEHWYGRKITDILKEVKSFVLSHEHVFHYKLKTDDYNWLMMVIQNEADRLKPSLRNKKMFNNFSRYDKTYPNEQYFGFLGQNHTDLRGRSFAFLINERLKDFKSLTSVINIHYENSYYLNWFTGHREEIKVPLINEIINNKRMRKKIIAYLKNDSPCEIILAKTTSIPFDNINELKKSSQHILYFENQDAASGIATIK